jgi:hypothetical protein
MNYQNREKRLPTKEEREAKKEQNRKDAEMVPAARKKADDAFRANFERLKAERLAREAAGNHSAFCWKANSRDERHPDRNGRGRRGPSSNYQ